MAQRAVPLPTTTTFRSSGPRRPMMQRVFGRDWQIAFLFIAPIVILKIQHVNIPI